MPLLRQAIWGNIWICTVEKNQTNATNAIMQLFRLAIGQGGLGCEIGHRDEDGQGGQGGQEGEGDQGGQGDPGGKESLGGQRRL